jgi:hypothetical protein
MADKKVIDWEAIEAAYSLGVRSNLDIASQYGVSEGGIRKKAKHLGWSKDLSAKIKLKAEERVRKSEYESSTKGKLSDKEAIEIAATTQANLIIAHRTDIAMIRGTTKRHQAELDLSEDLALRDKAQIGKMLTETLKMQIGLERQAFGISDNANGDSDTQKMFQITPLDLKI